jgi:catechol 2,3-dioxygenase-like lactoylglutathione lyase family enzyme
VPNRQSLISALSTSIERTPAKQLIEEAEALEESFLPGRWKYSDSTGGRFAEVAARIVHAAASRNLSRTKSVDDCLKVQWEHAPRGDENTAQLGKTAGVTGVRLDHVVIAVSDWDRSIAFYRDVLGAHVVDHPDGHVAFRFGNQQLNVHGPGLDLGTLVAAPPVVAGGSDLCFVWPGSHDELAEHLRAHGIVVEQAPVLRHGGAGEGTSTYFRDPDGSLLEFIVYPASWRPGHRRSAKVIKLSASAQGKIVHMSTATDTFTRFIDALVTALDDHAASGRELASRIHLCRAFTSTASSRRRPVNRPRHCAG